MVQNKVVQKDVQTFTQLIKHANIYLRFCKAKELDTGVFISLKGTGRNIKYGNLTSPFIEQKSCPILNLVTQIIDFSMSLLFNDHATYVIFTKQVY